MKTKSKIKRSPARKKVSPLYPTRVSDVYVTQGMLYKFRDELKACIRSENHQFRSEMHGMKSELHGMKSELHGMKSEIHEIKSVVHGLKGEIHRLALLIEDQNARNGMVIDQMVSLFGRQDRVEREMEEHRQFFADLKHAMRLPQVDK